jgi:hypothetical protein
MIKQIISFDIGIVNFAYCIAVIEDNNINFKEIQKINLNCNKKNNQDIVDAIIDLLEDITSKIDFNYPLIVLIENQITSSMKSIQTAINTYYKLICRYENIDIQTIYLSAKHKLNLINKYKDLFVNNEIIKNDKYKQNKIDSVLFTKWLLENKYKDDNILNYYNSISKKDDICDSYLMIIYYFEI